MEIDMKIFAHRVNDWKPGNIHGIYGAEIDVQFSDTGKIVAKHEPYGNQVPPIPIENVLKHSGFDKFFVDIKQNMDTKYLQKIVDLFGDKLHALFDVPYPSMFFCIREQLPVYGRISEQESAIDGVKGYWLDPLEDTSLDKYTSLLAQVPHNSKVIVCSPDLHLEPFHDVWEWLQFRINSGDTRIEGIVTKQIMNAKHFFK
jgi:hypothetical protein